MTDPATLLFSESPAPLGQYVRALCARNRLSGQVQIPRLQAVLSGVQTTPEKVAAYASVCGFHGDPSVLPLTYPHILAFPLHMELMLHKDFPLPLMGLVHIRNRISRRRPVRVTEQLTVHCRLGDSRATDKGVEFDIFTEISSNGESVWTSVSTNFCRRPAVPTSVNRCAAPAELRHFDRTESWFLPSDLGRRYARVSGDSNPIHLWPLSARLFGFRRHIAHGMWSKARIAASLADTTGDAPCTLITEFRQPVFLPAEVILHVSPLAGDNDGYAFELRNRNGDRVHVRGEISREPNAQESP